jgi:hypothetical protein
MLLQHKKELGRKRVAEVVVFRDEVKPKYDSPAVQIVFKIKDVPSTEPGELGEKMEQGMRDVQGHGEVRVRSVVRREEGNKKLRVHEFRFSRRDRRWQVS